ncbi:HAD family hydrolase [Streptomyces sp. NPDC059740]|uniref:HAD family hydrolase n=1 Tax=Streptomyces sp. NPDC059740 TaxID=3346926 RepID=UPI0036638828
MDEPKAALFDVDGTLVDTNYLHVTAWWEAFRQAGYRVGMRAVHHAVGLGSQDLVTHLLGEDVSEEDRSFVSSAHKALYGCYFDRLPAFDEAGRLLRKLAGSGWRVVLATSAGGHELSALKRAIDADDAIRATASADDVSHGKPAPDPVEHALELAGVPASRAVFVGDSVWDMKAASAAGVVPVALLSGGIPRHDLELAGATAVYQDPAHLLNQLDGSPLGG